MSNNTPYDPNNSNDFWGKNPQPQQDQQFPQGQQYQQPPQYPQQPQYQQPQYGPPGQYPGVPQQGGGGMGAASMVLGILSLVFFCCTYIAIPLALIGLILGAVSLGRKRGGKGMAIAGLVMSSISLIFGVVILVWAFAFIGELANPFDGLIDELIREFGIQL
jgi:hypothetical protein